MQIGFMDHGPGVPGNIESNFAFYLSVAAIFGELNDVEDVAI